jgi:hypothetical protein
VADAVVERLLGAAITDGAVSVRRQVLRALERNTALDPLLAQADWCASPTDRLTMDKRFISSHHPIWALYYPLTCPAFFPLSTNR